MKTIIVDSGRSLVKPLCRELNKDLVFPAAVAPGHTLSTDVQANSPLDLHLVVHHRPEDPALELSREVFVGEFAIRQKGAMAVTDRSRDKANPTNRILLAAAMSLFTNPFEEVHLVTNCPVRDWARQKDSLARILKGTYRVQHLRGMFARPRPTVKEFKVVECTILPEGPAALYGYVYDRFGRERHPEVAAGITAVLDIGDQTCNVTVLEDMDYRDEECFTLDLGLHHAHAKLLRWLEERCEGCNLTLPKLGRLLAKGETTYTQGGRVYFLKTERDRRYEELADAIWNELQARFSGTPDHVLLVGGGALALGEFLRARIRGSKVVWDAENSLWLTALGMDVMMKL